MVSPIFRSQSVFREPTSQTIILEEGNLPFKMQKLRELIDFRSVTVFFNSYETMEEVFQNSAIPCSIFTGEFLESLPFLQGSSLVLLTLDIYGGVEMQQNCRVISFDCPRTVPDYVARVAYCHNLGFAGEVVTLVAEDEKERWLWIQEEARRDIQCKLQIFSRDSHIPFWT
eukprot:TRINITY_DN11233_c0_g2_i1.p1 TRINITY_DN11233_c0_g2~~TRINITY_DN11233_c0_g2_i1.p1  ORF type:complete len:171 (-),score=34.85 TRINITY_DN11233_c0_g2_i1:131-643(-)